MSVSEIETHMAFLWDGKEFIHKGIVPDEQCLFDPELVGES